MEEVVKKIGYATVYRRGFMGRRGVIYAHKKNAVRQSNTLMHFIKIVVPVYVKVGELKKAKKVARAERKARAEKFNKICADARKEE